MWGRSLVYRIEFLRITTGVIAERSLITWIRRVGSPRSSSRPSIYDEAWFATDCQRPAI